MSVIRFPQLAHKEREDENPAIQIFGRRFYKDQTETEYLIEFLLLFLAPKYISNPEAKWGFGFPDKVSIENWPDNTPLEYEPPARLILKLFSFLGSSKLETRHGCHKVRFSHILRTLKERTETDYTVSKDQVLDLLEQLLCGFVGVAANRTWCTQTFLPVSRGLIAGETIWKRIKGNKKPDTSWEEAIKEGYYSFSSHDFMARGGELLYLQLCNLIRFFHTSEAITFEKKWGFQKSAAIAALTDITEGVKHFFQETAQIDELSKWIEDTDPTTQDLIANQRQLAKCGWCPAESWQEAYLFAYEFANICRAAIDPLEKVEMLTLCCVFQVLRSLCAQSVRYCTAMTDETRQQGGANGFAWLVTPPMLDDVSLRETAKQNLIRMQEIIHGALRHPDITVPNNYNYKKADEQGQELFVKLGKKIGLIAPWKGPGARIVITDVILRYLVLALIPPGSKMTLKTFEDRMFCHYGMAVSGSQLDRAVRWTYPRQLLRFPDPQKNWLEKSLLSTGFLIPLSDAVSQVQNPFGQFLAL